MDHLKSPSLALRLPSGWTRASERRGKNTNWALLGATSWICGEGQLYRDLRGGDEQLYRGRVGRGDHYHAGEEVCVQGRGDFSRREMG